MSQKKRITKWHAFVVAVGFALGVAALLAGVVVAAASVVSGLVIGCSP